MSKIFASIVSAGMILMLASTPVRSEEWIMASGYADSNFHTKNIPQIFMEICQPKSIYHRKCGFSMNF